MNKMGRSGFDRWDLAGRDRIAADGPLSPTGTARFELLELSRVSGARMRQGDGRDPHQRFVGDPILQAAQRGR